MTLRLEGPDRFVLGASDSTVRSIASALSASASGCVSRRSSSSSESIASALSASASGCVSRWSSSSETLVWFVLTLFASIYT